MIHSIALACFLTIALNASAATLPESPEHCEAAASDVGNSPIGLNYAQFDQTDGQGWRKLWDAQCYQASANLIEAYIATHRELAEQERRNLQFHRGQSLAFAGKADAAVASFGQCLRPEEVKNGFRWNAYLRGTIAFMKRNKTQLISAHDELSAHADNYGNAINLKVLSSFLENFEDSYAVAYSKPRR